MPAVKVFEDSIMDWLRVSRLSCQHRPSIGYAAYEWLNTYKMDVIQGTTSHDMLLAKMRAGVIVK